MVISSGCLSKFIVNDSGAVTVYVTTGKRVILVLEIVVHVNVPLFPLRVLPVPTMGIQPIANVRMVNIILLLHLVLRRHVILLPDNGLPMDTVRPV